MSYTRTQVRGLIRQRCGIENTTAQVDSEINDHINDATAYAHDFYIGTYGDKYAIENTSVTTSSGTSSYTIAAADFYQPVAVMLVYEDEWLPLYPLGRAGRGRQTTAQPWGPGLTPQYSITRQLDGTYDILFDPPPDAAETIKIDYHPVAPTYTSDSDSVTIPHVDLVVVEACRRVKDKEDRDPSTFIAERDAIQKRIEDWVGSIDDGIPDRTQVPMRRPRRLRDRLF